ncbi:hypothetical protein RCL1_008470 [Eukaryota sp. TZLM3-RCL]
MVLYSPTPLSNPNLQDLLQCTSVSEPKLRTSTLDERLADERTSFSLINKSSVIGNQLDNLKHHLQTLNDEISILSNGISERKSQLGLLQGQRRQLVRRINLNNQWMERFSQYIKPLEDKYDSLVSSLRDQQMDLADKYKESMSLLIEKFDFHPQFKTPHDEQIDAEWFGGVQKPTSTFQSKNSQKAAFDKAFSVRKRMQEYTPSRSGSRRSIQRSLS